VNGTFALFTDGAQLHNPLTGEAGTKESRTYHEQFGLVPLRSLPTPGDKSTSGVPRAAPLKPNGKLHHYCVLSLVATSC
jgi:hypothetical protein